MTSTLNGWGKMLMILELISPRPPRNIKKGLGRPRTAKRQGLTSDGRLALPLMRKLG
jgi:hypothetical protein